MKASEAIQQFKKMQHVFRVASILQLTTYMWPQPAQLPNVATYDYIIVGGGTAGCVIASRLIEIKNVHVLLVEAGGNPPFESLYPRYFQYMKHTSVDWNITSKKEPTTRHHRDGVVHISQGRMLGGTSSLNYMAYMHGDNIDFAIWATIANDSSWSYEAVRPIFMKNENLIDNMVLNSRKDRNQHGTNGPLKLRRFYDKQTEKYLTAFAELGNEIVTNINSKHPLGFTHLLHTCSSKDRQSTAYSFLRLVKDHPRLHVMTHSLVTEIIFDDSNTAVGVKIEMQDKKSVIVRANKEIILTAGVFKTPQLLMVSGVGPEEHLRKKNIKVVVDLPVGQNLQDHPTVMSVFKTDARVPDTEPPNPYKFEFPIFDGKVAVDRRKNYPDYNIRSIILNDPQMFLKLCVLSFGYTETLCNHLLKGTSDREIYVALNYLAYPRSRGQLQLISKNMNDQPEIQLGYYNNEEDLEVHANYLMHFNDILNTSYFKSINAQFVDPKLSNCKELDMDDINYWKCYASSMVTTSNYICGTCAMGSVVDSQLFVKGVQRLRIADASIMPTLTAAPTAATVIMIAEKASIMIKKSKCEY